MFCRTFRSASNHLRNTKSLRQFSAASGGGGGFGAALPLSALALAAAGYTYYQSTDLETKISSLEASNKDLQVQLSGKTNSAFVFIKPHACKGTPGKVEAAVEEHLKKAGIRIMGQSLPRQ
jgi:hypothetical protein